MPTSARRRLLLCALALQLAAGVLVLATGATAAGTDVAIDHGGTRRVYRLYVPPTVPKGSPAPLVLALHGLNGTPDKIQSATGLDALARTQRFVVAYPVGRIGSWNAGTCCGRSAQDQVDDVGFLATVIADIRRRMPVERVFATGFSTGGMMALRLACDRPHLVAAVASVEGTLVTKCGGSQPVHTMYVNGRRDPTVPYLGSAYSTWLRSPLAPIPVAVGHWERRNACSGLPEVNRTAAVVVRVYPRCIGASSVRLVTLTNTAHSWPTAKADSFAASEEIWRFFAASQQPLDPPARAAALTTQTTAALATSGGRTFVVGEVSGRFDVVLRARVTVEVLDGASWKLVATRSTSLEGAFRIPVQVPAGARLLVHYRGPGLPSSAPLT